MAKRVPGSNFRMYYDKADRAWRLKVDISAELAALLKKHKTADTVEYGSGVYGRGGPRRRCYRPPSRLIEATKARNNDMLWFIADSLYDQNMINSGRKTRIMKFRSHYDCKLAIEDCKTSARSLAGLDAAEATRFCCTISIPEEAVEWEV